MDIANPRAAFGDPMFRELKLRDVARVEMNADDRTVELINKAVHLGRAHEEPIGKDVLHVEQHSSLFRERLERLDCGGRAIQQTWFATGSGSGPQGMYTAPGTTRTFLVPSACAAAVMRLA